MALPRLRVGDSGDEVAHLHEMLKLQGVEISPEEQKRKFFGPATREAVSEFQKANGVEPSCELCEETATLLAGQSAAAITPGIKLTPPSPFIPGVIVPPAVHLTPTTPAAPSLPATGGSTPGATGQRQVEGRIFFDHGLPAGGVTLRLYNKGFGGAEAQLGEIKTDNQGSYALPYDSGGKAANLEVRAVDAEGKEIPLSATKFNAGKQEVLNLVAPSGMQSQANEFHLMANDLAGLVGGDVSKLALAKETDEHPDVSLLHENTGWDARLIATAATAAKMNAVTGIAHNALYGAFRAGLPDDPESLAMVSTEAFATALTRAKEAGVIALDDAQMIAAQTAFVPFKLETLRKMVVPGTLSSMGEMIEKAPIELTRKATFEKLVLMHDGDDAALWTEAKAQGIPAAEIASLQWQGKLAYLTLNNAPLTEALQAEIPSQDNLTQLVEKDLYRKEEWVTRLKGLASDNNAVNPDKLAKLIPTAYAQKEVNDRLDAYAGDLARKVRQTFPTHVVTRMVENDELKLGAQHAEMKAPVQAFLKNAVDKGFQLGSTPVDQFLKQQGKKVFDGIAEDKKGLAEAGVKLLTRVYQMTPNDEAMTTLLNLGFTSARQVSAIPKAAFVDRHWERFGSRKVAETVWDKSVQITSVTFNIYTLGKKIDSTPPLMAISGSPEKHSEAKDKLKSLLKEYPTMESLFGSLDFCECEHCRSVLSPAAYLVDLLRFVDPPKQDWKHTLEAWKNTHKGERYQKDWVYDHTGEEFEDERKKPYDALILRRPDLPHLPLTCENTNTALPYIDLVNEILEYYVANNQLDPKAVHDTGEATSAELMAEPHNTIPKAYDTLKGARYPLTLPFDLWLETVRRFCEYFETPLWQVLDVFRPSDDLFAPATNPAAYYRAQIFSEYLGLSPDEYTIYTGPALTDWPKLYGYDKVGDTEASALAKLKSAKTLSHRLGVSYKELTALVKTAFVNPKLSTLVTLHKLGIEVSDVFRYKKHPAYLPITQEQKDEAPHEDAEFEKRLQQLTEKFKPNFDAKQWLTDAWDQHKFEKVLVLRDPDAGCSFDETLVAYTGGADAEALDFVKLNLLVRLWKRLGWTMEETDRALQAFWPANVAISEATLGNGMKTAMVYLAHLKELAELISLGKNSRMKLLTMWADLPSNGKNSLYAQLFLTRNILKDDVIFDDPLGDYLSKPGVLLKDHLPALQAALDLTADEITRILLDGNTGDESDVNKAMLSLANVSLLYRYRLLSKALKLSIDELVVLKALSGLNPFHALSPDALDDIKNDFPLNQTLEFVRRTQQVKAGAFAINDLDYLFRHRFDPLGKYRENSDVRLAWVSTLAAELRMIASDYAVPADADSVSDDALRQKMSLVFTPDVVETFMGFWLDKAVYSAIKEPVPPGKRLNPATYGVNGVSVSYDDTRQRQQVTHVGVLTAGAKTTLLNQIPQPLPADQNAIDARKNFSDLLDEIVSKSSVQFEAFFGKHFDGLLKFDDFFGAGVTATPAEKRLSLLKRLLPFLQAKLTRQTILRAMTTQTGGDAALIEALLTNSDFLALPDAGAQSLMARFEGLGRRGLTTVLTPSDSTAQPINKTADDVEVKASDVCKQAQWRGFIEVPQSGAYRFYAKLGKKDATVDLRFNAVTEPILNGKAAKDGDELSGFIELKAGVLYALTLVASNLQNGAFELLFKGETTPKDKLSQLVVMPQAEVDGAARAYTMLTKALQLVQGLGLSEHDVRHILAHPSDFGGVNWRLLPTQETTGADAANAVALFNATTQLMNYAALKRDLAGGGDDLIAIFERARQTNPETADELCKRIATLTRRKTDVVRLTAAELGMTAPEHFADEQRMERLWQALQIVEKFGVQVASLKKWLTPTPDANVAMDVRNTIKSRYEPETWQRIAKAIFDPLRQRQRDALVAHILHLKEDEGLNSIEKLFEYFLIDPGMEPVVQTSRLRLAISSLQTFIQRCFLNLEKQVHPSVLNAQHWAWMKRYRVWEANRKIFLFPENWLEPEWRDDKTHLYQELESSLLQGDVTNQLAEDALYVYLKKLDQLARLEIVTMYAEEKPPGPPTMHVIGRTYALPHQYFYRRYARQMWTAWEPVTTEIDGEHIVAVMWRERLHLFWLTFMEKVEESTGGPSTGETRALGGLGLNTLITAAATASKGAVNRMLDMQLNWSEYFQGAWTVRESSGFGNPFTMPPNKLFDASKVFVTVSKETGADGAVLIKLNGWYEDDALHISQRPYFRVVSKNSRPQLKYDFYLFPPPSPYSTKNKTYNRYIGSDALSVTFVQKIVTTDGNKQASPPATQPILAKGRGYTLLPSSNQMTLPNAEFAPLISPVFYADDVYTFFVEPSLTEEKMDQWQGYTITRPSQKSKWAEYVVKSPPISALLPPKYLQAALEVLQNIPQLEAVNPLALHAIKPNLDSLTQFGTAVRFGNAVVGSTGRLQDHSALTDITTSIGVINQKI